MQHLMGELMNISIIPKIKGPRHITLHPGLGAALLAVLVFSSCEGGPVRIGHSTSRTDICEERVVDRIEPDGKVKYRWEFRPCNRARGDR